MKTYQPKINNIKRDWVIMDAKDKILGRLSSKIATLLMGKHKRIYTPNQDLGDYVVVINAKYVKLSGKKTKQKVYRRHSGYPGGFKEIKFEKLISEQPAKVIELAVKRMLPSNRLRNKRMRRLKVFAESEHRYKDKIKSN